MIPWETAARIATLAIVMITLVYNGPLVVMGVLFARRSDGSLGSQLVLDGQPPAALPAGWSIFVLVPCLNEERVISHTVRGLLASQPGTRVIVVDDGSDDATARRAMSAGAGRITVVTRTLPEARLGKGAALNTGLRCVRRRVECEGLDPARVLVCVLDADGRMTPGAASQVVPLFGAPTVGGAQLAVRIRGRGHGALRLQDLEFWGLSAMNQFGRVSTGSVSMGGNGQFTRLSALDTIGEQPWSDSLTEDLDLGISLAVHGWTVTSTTGAYVSQQGLTDPRRLLRQRTRWFQGHMSAVKRLPELWAGSRATPWARVELTCYLLNPYLVTLPWSVVQQYVLFRIVGGHGAGLFTLPSGPLWLQVLGGIGWYALSSVGYLALALLYWRRTGDLPIWKALLYSHAFLLWIYVSFIAAWRAAWRMAIRRKGWIKSERTEEAAVATARAVVPPVTRGAR
ncbi:glycosyltransferase [Streptomyces olivoreticuli]